MHGFVTYFLDCYNANPDSMKSAIEFCDSINTEFTKHYVLASMLELGTESDYEHKKIIEAALNCDADNLYFFGDDIFSAFQGLKLSSSKKIYKFKTNEFELLKEMLKENLSKDDFVLLKGSRSMELERLESVLKEGNV
nr:cyanophycin synthetase [Treponema sp. OMZ 788]